MREREARAMARGTSISGAAVDDFARDCAAVEREGSADARLKRGRRTGEGHDARHVRETGKELARRNVALERLRQRRRLARAAPTAGGGG